jgi:hypothetical protein
MFSSAKLCVLLTTYKNEAYMLSCKITTPGSQKLKAEACWEFFPEALRFEILNNTEQRLSCEETEHFHARVLAIITSLRLPYLRWSSPAEMGTVSPLSVKSGGRDPS